MTVQTVNAADISVTVYNSNLGVVTELRKLDFKKGIGQLAFHDVPSAIDAASVQFELLDSRGSVSILEQNYVYDLVSPQRLYQRYIDQQIELIDREGRLFSGRLLAASSNAVTLSDKSGKVKVISLDHITEVNFPKLPEGLITRPTLFWKYQSDIDGKLESRVGYQTGGMNWSAEYVATLDDDERNLDLSGWASITNNSGKTYNDATLKLVAGEIHRAQPSPLMGVRSGTVMKAIDGYAGFQEKAFFEYHLYTLPRPSTLANNEIKQLSLFEPARTPVEKVYIYRPDQNPTAVSVAVKFVNSQENGLGLPLPAGRVRLFKKDSDGSMILLGEDRIKHTPRDEELNLTVGNAFDIVAEHKVSDQRRISSKIEERTFEIELRNRKEKSVTIMVEKRLYGFWEIISSSHTYKKKDAGLVEFEIPVSAGKTAILTLTVRFTSR